ncbi:MAG TPA: hypothetical protein VLA02_03305, partial [Reyranella sp.]|nr:hypothetical protein [Reyranella sp.]
YRGWVAESTVRRLRESIWCMASNARATPAGSAGVEIAMVLEEAEPIGGFTGISVSEPLLQGGILVSVVGYMFVLQRGLLSSDLRSFCRRRSSSRCCRRPSIGGRVTAS